MSVRQEKDVYDLDLLKYMRTKGRGISKPPKHESGRSTATDTRKTDANLAAIAIIKGTSSGPVKTVESTNRGRNVTMPDEKRNTVRYMPTNSLKWDPNNFAPTLLQ
jgi:hypothetical protein